jgi:protein-S-isoprenylcysteine O-methyltransferase Ste14
MDADLSSQAAPSEPPTQAADVPAGKRASMLPERRERPPLESAFVRLIATGGVVAIGVALGAILVSQNVQGWIVGLVVALVSVVLSAVLWSSRRL